MSQTIFTQENYDLLTAFVSKNKDRKGCLIPILNECQKIYGCVPMKVQQYLSAALHIPLSEIYGVVTFYSQFSIEPKGEHVIGVCLGTACYVKEAQKILDEIQLQCEVEVGQTTKDRKFTLEATRCIGACGLAPVMTIGEDVYGRLTANEVNEILKKY